MSFQLHPSAAQDLREIYETIAEENASAAASMIEALENACRFLGENPNGGRARPDLHENLRSFAVGPYLLLYRAVGLNAEIVFVAHGRRDLAALVERDAR